MRGWSFQGASTLSLCKAKRMGCGTASQLPHEGGEVQRKEKPAHRSRFSEETHPQAPSQADKRFTQSSMKQGRPRTLICLLCVFPTVDLRKLKLSQPLVWTQSQLCGARCSKHQHALASTSCPRVGPAAHLAVQMHGAPTGQSHPPVPVASGLRVPSRATPACSCGEAMLLPCLSLSEACTTLHLPASLAHGRESTAYRFHGDIPQKDRVYLDKAHVCSCLWGISQPPTSLSPGPSTTGNSVCFRLLLPRG